MDRDCTTCAFYNKRTGCSKQKQCQLEVINPGTNNLEYVTYLQYESKIKAKPEPNYMLERQFFASLISDSLFSGAFA